METKKYKLDKHNLVLISALTILYTIKFFLFMPQNAYSFGYNYGGIIFIIGMSFVISYLTYLISKKDVKSMNSGFRITFYIFLIINILSFISQIGNNIQD